MSIDDLFETRKVFVKNMVQCFSDIETPSTFCIDAGWGYGKTTFLDALSEELLENNFCVLRYNSWENDYEQDPFTSLLLSILPQIHQYLTKQEKAEMFAVDLVCKLIAGTLAVTKAITSIKLPFLPSAFEIGKDSMNYLPAVREWINGDSANIPEVSPQQKCLASFKANLLDLSKKLKCYNQSFKTIVVLIDELDRCRPSYAIELLERVKHILNQEGFVFVFALNKETLEKTVKTMYGEVDPDGYLRRFFDYELVLPEPDLGEFSSQLIQNIEISELKANSLIIFSGMVKQAKCSLRDVEKMFKKLIIALRMIPDEKFDESMNFFLPFCILTMNQATEWYKKFFCNPGILETETYQIGYTSPRIIGLIKNDISMKRIQKNETIVPYKVKNSAISLFYKEQNSDNEGQVSELKFCYNNNPIFSIDCVCKYQSNVGASSHYEVTGITISTYKKFRAILTSVYHHVNSICPNKDSDND